MDKVKDKKNYDKAVNMKSGCLLFIKSEGLKKQATMSTADFINTLDKYIDSLEQYVRDLVSYFLFRCIAYV